MLNLILQIADTAQNVLEETGAKTNTLIEQLGGNHFFNKEDFLDLLWRYGFNFLIAFVLIRLIYYPVNKRKDYLFTFFIFNSIIFILCWMMSSSKQSLGFAFGLFAVFSILRYRTDPVPIKEMAYFFVCITLGVMNAMATKKISFVELVFANLIILAMTYALDNWIWRNLTNENMKEIEYERIDLITPENRENMLTDLRVRTGLPVHRFEILRIDFLRDVARIKAFYYSKDRDAGERPVDDGDDD